MGFMIIERFLQGLGEEMTINRIPINTAGDGDGLVGCDIQESDRISFG